MALKDYIILSFFVSIYRPREAAKKVIFFSGPEEGGGCKGRATKKNELFLKLEKNQVKNVATKNTFSAASPISRD